MYKFLKIHFKREIFMKKWNKPEISNLCVQLTNEFEIEPLKNKITCTPNDRKPNLYKDETCLNTECPYHEKKNDNKGKGGKCRGLNGFIS